MSDISTLNIRLFFFYILAGCLIVFSGCKPFEPVRIVKIITDSITEITISSAVSGGHVIDDGGEPITSRGICWNTSGNPTIQSYDGITTNGSGDGRFNSTISGLTDGSTYYVRAYATNSSGTSYGNEIVFTVFECGNSIISDYDGNEYPTVRIGNQCWMKENLGTTHYSDGTPIQLVVNEAAWEELINADKAYCTYDNSSSSGEVYGALYTWAAAMNGSNSSSAVPSDRQGVCPEGWHLPSDGEWKVLEMNLGLRQSEADGILSRGTVEGGKMKEAGTAYWTSPNEGATNSSGFSALPGGNRIRNGEFRNIGEKAYFWSSTMNFDYDNFGHGWYRSLGYDHSQIYRGSSNRTSGFSVRCVRDE